MFELSRRTFMQTSLAALGFGTLNGAVATGQARQGGPPEHKAKVYTVVCGYPAIG